MNYTLIRLDHLDKHNATQIEANIDAVTFAELDSAKETGSRLASVTRDLHRGNMFLITDAPRTPLFCNTEGSLELTESHSVTLPPDAIEKATQRIIPATQAGGNAGRSSFTETSSENLQPADESTTTTQEDITTHQRDDRTRYYYNIEIACPASKAATYAPGTFNLGATDNEPKQDLTLRTTASENAWYSAECTCNEPKKLFYKPNGSADSNLGIQPVKLSTTCAVSEAKEAYIPVTPAVQVNERLGFPTKGYFYHFHGNVLIHEYKIDTPKCTFGITHSRSGHIDDSVKFTKSQHSILLFWRINGKIVNNQYLLYKKEQLTTTDLTEMTGDWLQENGFEVGVAALQDARSEPIATSAVEDLPAVAPKKVQHYENIWYKYPHKELTPDILAVKKGTQPCDIAVCNVAEVESEWTPVPSETGYPVLIFETKQKRFNHNLPEPNPDAPDLKHGDEDRATIEGYGLGKPFAQHDVPTRAGIKFTTEDQFLLPASEHFRRMRFLENYFSWAGDAEDVFTEMVNKFERNEGGSYSNGLLTKLLRKHDSTDSFKKALIIFLNEYVGKKTSISPSIADDSFSFMINDPRGEKIPKFTNKIDHINGGVLTVHGIYAMEVYLTDLERNGHLLRGNLSFKIQDHFGLDPHDIDHTYWAMKPFESLSGFRSWYLLQHYNKYNYKPFTTVIDFELDF